MDYTEYLKLKKPGFENPANILDLSENFETIDAEAKRVNQNLSGFRFIHGFGALGLGDNPTWAQINEKMPDTSILIQSIYTGVDYSNIGLPNKNGLIEIKKQEQSRMIAKFYVTDASAEIVVETYMSFFAGNAFSGWERIATGADVTRIDSELSNKAQTNGEIFTGTIGVRSAYPTIRLQTADGTEAGSLSSTPSGAAVYLRSAETGVLVLNEGLIPETSGNKSLGRSTQVWGDLYVKNSPIVTSDQRIKKDISPLEISLIIKLLMSIPAVRYRLIDGESGRFHYGFRAQDVEAALTAAELTGMDFAGFIKTPAVDEDGTETGDYIYALRLEEFIPILWAHSQDVERRLQAAGL